MNRYEDDQRFEEALARTNERVAHGESVEHAIAAEPTEFHAELLELLGVGAQVSALRAEPSPQFAAALEAQLLDAVDAARGEQHTPSWWQRVLARRVATFSLAAMLAVALLGGSGLFVSQASAESLPGEALYPVRQAKEWVLLRFAPAGERRVDAQGGLLDSRGADLERALAKGRKAEVLTTLTRDAAASADAMVNEAIELAGKQQPRAAVRALLVLRKLDERLENLEAHATQPEARAQIEALRTHLREEQAKLLASAGPRRGRE